MAEMSPLRRRMIEDMTVRNLSPATQRSYLHAVSKFSRYFSRSPHKLGLEDVRAYQVHLVANGISWAGLNQIVCALRFFYGVTLGHGEIPERIPFARTPRILPEVLGADEVVRFLEAVPSLKTRTALATAYAAGLRASETVGLKLANIDSSRMVIRVEHGKGGKDRYVMLSTQLLSILRTYWRIARPEDWLFPGRDATRPIDPQVLYSACRSACKAAGLTDNGIQFADLPKNRMGPTALWRGHMFDRVCGENDIEHRLTKPNHPWTNGQVERMNRTLKDATVKRYHYGTHAQLKEHVQAFLMAYNFAKRLKMLRGLTPYEYICKIWTTEPKRFRLNPLHHTVGLNT